MFNFKILNMPIPKWMKTVLKAMSTSDESAGEHILNKTIEKANTAKTDEEKKESCVFGFFSHKFIHFHKENLYFLSVFFSNFK